MVSRCICEKCSFDRLWDKTERRLHITGITLKRGNAKLIDIWELESKW